MKWSDDAARREPRKGENEEILLGRIVLIVDKRGDTRNGGHLQMRSIGVHLPYKGQ